MEERNMSIAFSSKISAITEHNTSFDSGILRVCYTGRNRNNSFISKETFERCMPSIYNCPIVCRYDRDADEIGAHDMELVTDGGGDMRLVNLTQPVGVVPESAEYWWENIEDDTGLHEYLCVNVLLWKRQEAYRKIRENGITDESMEISVKEGEMIDGVYVIKRFEFTAFCLLGSAQPCYESASLEMFSCDSFKAQLDEMMKEFKEELKTAQSLQKVCINRQNYSEGGERILEEKNALMAQFGLSAEMLDFNIEDFGIEELRAKFEAMKPGDKSAENPESFALEGEFYTELRERLSEEKTDTPWGVDCRYWLWDYDKDNGEVYGVDIGDRKIYGMPYKTDGDRVVIDFAGRKRMKLAVVPFDEGGQADPVSGMFAAIAEKYSANNAQWTEKYQSAADTIAAMENELDALRRFKEEADFARAKSERDEVLAKFNDLNGVEAFETLREKSAEYSAEELEEKCFALRGRYGTEAKFAYEQKAPRLPVIKSGGASEPYGGIFAEYGIIPSDQHN